MEWRETKIYCSTNHLLSIHNTIITPPLHPRQTHIVSSSVFIVLVMEKLVSALYILKLWLAVRKPSMHGKATDDYQGVSNNLVSVELQESPGVEPTLVCCWATVGDGGPTTDQCGFRRHLLCSREEMLCIAGAESTHVGHTLSSPTVLLNCLLLYFIHLKLELLT